METEFHTAFGRAVVMWQRVEMRLFAVFFAAIGAEDRDPLGAAFNSVPTFRTRLEMVDAALKFCGLDPALLTEWDVLRTALDKANTTRNKLAHGHMYFDQDRGNYLIMGSFDHPAVRETFDKGGTSYRLKDLATQADRFLALQDKLNQFTSKMIWHPDGTLISKKAPNGR